MYKTFPIDLTTVLAEGHAPNSKNELVSEGTRITEIAVLSMPGGADFRLQVGTRNTFFTVNDKFSMAPTGENQSNKGLFYANPNAQAGVIVELIVVFADEGDTASTRLNAVT